MKKFVYTVAVVVLLAVVFWWGGNAPGLHGWTPEQTAVDTTEQQEVVEEEVTIKDEPVIENTPVTPKPVQQEKEVQNLTCTLTIRCDTILDNMDWLQPEKQTLVPQNGIIYSASDIVFNEGETVFDVLLREVKANNIHMEFVSTPAYNSVYIEGINNIYEFDCGEMSGWMYKVNDIFPNYGCSLHKLNDKDSVELVYTCDFGKDVGGDYFSQQGVTDE